jgi:hypothetical protein
MIMYVSTHTHAKDSSPNLLIKNRETSHLRKYRGLVAYGLVGSEGEELQLSKIRGQDWTLGAR